MILNLTGLCSTVKSCVCSAIAHRVTIFDVSCMEYILHGIQITKSAVIRNTNKVATPDTDLK